MAKSGKTEDVALPKTAVSGIVAEFLPADFKLSNDARDLLSDCCAEFINLVSSEAAEIAEAQKKNTVLPEHILLALDKLDFATYAAAGRAEIADIKTKGSGRNKRKKPASGMTPEEEIALERKLLAAAAERMAGGAPANA